MKTSMLLTLGALVLGLTTNAFAQGSAFTWQGHLTEAGQPANGLYDLTFALYGFATGGTALDTKTINGATVVNGLYTETLDFGPGVFDGNPRWLELSLNTTGVADFTTLAPRQPITATPYAIRAVSAGTATTAGSLSGMLPDSQLSINVARLNANNVFTSPINLPANGLVAGTNQLVLAGGNVGIGTAEPQAALHIEGPDGTQPLFKLKTPGNYQSSMLWFQDEDANPPSGAIATMDLSNGDGLFNLVAGAYCDERIYKYGSTRGASRIQFHDGTISLYVSSLLNGGGQVAGDPVTFYQTLGLSDSSFIVYTGAGTERVRVDSVGNVGIGTSGPQEKLDINGTVKATSFKGNGSALTDITPSSAAGGDLSGTYPNPTLANNAASLSKVSGGLIWSANNNVGITPYNTPTAALDVMSNDGDPVLDLVMGVGGGESPIFRVFMDGPKTDSTLGFTINRNGNVGIGTAIPTAKLDVTGDIKATNVFTGQVTATKFLGDGSSLGGVAPASGSTNYVAKAGDTMTGALNLPPNGLNVGGGQLYLANGNVGIGTFPSVLLDIHGRDTNSVLDIIKGIGDSASPIFRVFGDGPKTDSTLVFTIVRNGNVGIGTATPQSKLDVAGQVRSSAGGFMFPDGTVQTTKASGSGTVTGSGTSGQLALWTGTSSVSGNNNLYWDGSNSRLGIGTSSPQAKLDVNGAITATSFKGIGTELTGVPPSGTAGNALAGTYPNPSIADGAVTNAALVNNAVTAAKLASDPASLNRVSGGACTLLGGNLGIGTTVPAQKLHIYASGHPRIIGEIGDAASGDIGLEFRRAGSVKFDLGLPSNQWNNFRIWDGQTGASLLEIDTSGNVGIGTVNPATKLDVAGEVTCVAINITSDRNAKEQFKPINARAVLDKVARLPISEWQYKEQSDARHLGPMAQDFREAFALGRDERYITSVDADGVALAAIQGLNEKLDEKTREVEALKQSVAELRELVNKLASQQNGDAK
ncbi:MAG: tail fiber domain-containing protein [Verrucomicrobia bacterium]|nr:tail fiber domain-containing protein [Verrucomicrobiota bacterium]